ncbi:MULTISPECIES: RHS repeat-associated core domain-containing protein [unclassified Pseudomonas]|uniref:RHS repeat-associated core domain-containing protein n=1 Tax=unclassified Pseudomonas TaxID=196821 RepID=UPI002113C588|nr:MULTISPECIES: RHS repeat-associated core domain-containing protein [unclassified Pseudomonas]MCU1738150.1 RHS repeat protein [Pseudomonas sp. 20S_6.2_Bac1]
MSRLTGGIHSHTPTLAVVDPRGLAVRVVAYCRSIETVEPEERINRSAYDAMGRLTEQWDPRLWALSAEVDKTPANLTNAYSLSGKVLGSISVDAGRRVSLFGDGDQLVQTWDSRGSERRVEYDDLLRPLAIFEQGEGEAPRCTERYEHADGSADFAAHNQCGQLIRHDDPAGTLTVDNYALTGGVLEQTQRFVHVLETPDWPPGLAERDALLESSELAATTSSRFNPLGDVLEQVDAKGNRQLFDYTFDGQLLATHLQLTGRPAPQTLVSAIRYSAYGQVEQETAGNSVVSTLTYRPEDGRLTRLQARRGSDALQDLRYDYDPVGNVLSIEDAALPIRYFANQRVEPAKHYDYDSLYQLIEATGWEAGAASRGPEFNRFDDPGAVANYHQTYRYDAGGNLLELVHVGPQNHSRKLTAARYSNRCLSEQNGRPPTEEEIAAAFDGNGNLLDLQPGQAMSWDLRNQLREVRPVERESADDDRELYLYDGDGMRQRKVRSAQTNARSLISEVRYLPGLEIRTREGTGEVLQVICAQAGRSAMQVLHWETAPPSGIANNQYRYNLTDHLGSSSLELDSEGEVISQETYHPYGSTAWFAGRSEVEASYKTVRYSGKERDATGLYYYGFRYYAPWLQRWINPDPAGGVDGLNVYAFVQSGPISRMDKNGLWGDEDQKLNYFRANPPPAILRGQDIGFGAARVNQRVIAHGLDAFLPLEREAVADALFESPLVLQEAQWMQQNRPDLSEPVLRDIFGPDHTQEHSVIVDSWARTENFLRQYHNSGLGRGKFVRGGGGDARIRAYVYKSDFEGHVFIGNRFIHEPKKRKVETLIHEVSHLSRVDRFVGVGPGTQDFYYLLSNTASGRQYASDIVRHGNVQSYHLENTSVNFIAAVKEWEAQAIGDAENIIWDEQISMLFHNITPGLRAHIAARNADSLAVAAMELSTAFNSVYHYR